MRGALLVGGFAAACRRIIPADAGSTAGAAVEDTDRPDHPRGCGEHQQGFAAKQAAAGSSPRMRGAQPQWQSIFLTVWIIPADARSTGAETRHLNGLGDHPRGCGEHGVLTEEDKQYTGSSPRMRGARHRRGIDSALPGIIPADAGSTGDPGRSWCRSTDHPRGCGEHAVQDGRPGCRPGSSPRMRGAHSLPACSLNGQGIIPADAGST